MAIFLPVTIHFNSRSTKKKLIKGAAGIAAGRELGLDDMTTMQLMREKQRKARRERKGLSDSSYRNDEQIQEIDAYEREFQRDKPQREANPYEQLEYGADEADLQQFVPVVLKVSNKSTKQVAEMEIKSEEGTQDRLQTVVL